MDNYKDNQRKAQISQFKADFRIIGFFNFMRRVAYMDRGRDSINQRLMDRQYENPLLQQIPPHQQQGTLPFREVALHEPVSSSIFSGNEGEDGEFGMAPQLSEFSKPLNEIPICLIDARFGRMGEIARENASFVGVVIDPTNNSILTTGVLITPTLFITSGHYSIKSGRLLTDVFVSFDFEHILCRGKLETPRGCSRYKAKLRALSIQPEPDFAIFKVTLPPNHRFSIFSYQRDPHFLIHHGKGCPKVATSIEAPFNPHEISLSYIGKTYEGTSGAPLFTSSGGLYAIHSYVYENVRDAMPVENIMQHLKEITPVLHNEICLFQRIPNDFNISQGFANIVNAFNERDIALRYNNYIERHQKPFLNFQYEVYTVDYLRALPSAHARNLPLVTRREHEKIQRQAKEHFLNQIKSNLSQVTNPFTPEFEDKHVYNANEAERSRKNQSLFVANTRHYGVEFGAKDSSSVYITREQGMQELTQAISQLNIDNIEEVLYEDNIIGYGIRYGLPPFKSSSPYKIHNTEVTFSRPDHRKLGKTENEYAKFRFAVTTDEFAHPKICHFVDSVPEPNDRFGPPF